MPVVIAVAGFLGAWLLVAGPVYQAAVELDEKKWDRSGVLAALGSMPPPERVSAWWWLLPPVAVVLHRRSTRRWQTASLERLPAAQVRQIVDYGATATGWLFVGAGGALIAVKETWEMVEALEWAHWLFWVLLVVALVVSLANAALRVRRDHRTMSALQSEPQGTPDQQARPDVPARPDPSARPDAQTRPDASA